MAILIKSEVDATLNDSRNLRNARGEDMIFDNWLEDGGHAIGHVPKNASTAIRDAINRRTQQTIKYTQDSVKSFNERIVFIREPFERFNSAYSMFWYLNENGYNGQSGYVTYNDTHGYPDDPVKSYEHWVDFAIEKTLSRNVNLHWYPQYIQYGVDKNIPTKYFRFDDVNKVWGDYWPGFLPRQNALTEHRPTTDYRKDDLEILYHRDIALYNSIIPDPR